MLIKSGFQLEVLEPFLVPCGGDKAAATLGPDGRSPLHSLAAQPGGDIPTDFTRDLLLLCPSALYHPDGQGCTPLDIARAVAAATPREAVGSAAWFELRRLDRTAVRLQRRIKLWLVQVRERHLAAARLQSLCRRHLELFPATYDRKGLEQPTIGAEGEGPKAYTVSEAVHSRVPFRLSVHRRKPAPTEEPGQPEELAEPEAEASMDESSDALVELHESSKIKETRTLTPAEKASELSAAKVELARLRAIKQNPASGGAALLSLKFEGGVAEPNFFLAEMKRKVWAAIIWQKGARMMLDRPAIERQHAVTATKRRHDATERLELEREKLTQKLKIDQYTKRLRRSLYWNDEMLAKYLELQLKMDETVGLEAVKAHIRQLFDDTMGRCAVGEPVSLRHTLLTGEFGTGKRTAAKLIAMAVGILCKSAKKTSKPKVVAPFKVRSTLRNDVLLFRWMHSQTFSGSFHLGLTTAVCVGRCVTKCIGSPTVAAQLRASMSKSRLPLCTCLAMESGVKASTQQCRGLKSPRTTASRALDVAAVAVAQQHRSRWTSRW